MSWFAISVTYIRFRQGMDYQGFDRSTLPYKSRFAYYGAWYACIMIAIIQFFSGFSVFLNPNAPGYTFDHATFWTNYIPLGLFPILYLGKKFISKTSIRRVADMDFITNIAEIEASEQPEVRHPKWWGRLADAVF
jgi:amino acid transporter